MHLIFTPICSACINAVGRVQSHSRDHERARVPADRVLQHARELRVAVRDVPSAPRLVAECGDHVAEHQQPVVDVDQRTEHDELIAGLLDVVREVDFPPAAAGRFRIVGDKWRPGDGQRRQRWLPGTNESAPSSFV